jgi:hypothetical protein
MIEGITHNAITTESFLIQHAKVLFFQKQKNRFMRKVLLELFFWYLFRNKEKPQQLFI